MTTDTFPRAVNRILQELVNARTTWDQFQTLYFDPESVRLLNVAAPWFFAITQQVLLEQVLIIVSRLTDTPKKENLTINVLLNDPALVSKPDVQADLERLIKDARGKADKIRRHRHKTIAHLDYQTAVGTASPLPTLLNREIVEALSALEAVYRLYRQRLYDADVDFTVRGAGGASALVRTLAAAEGWQLRQEEEDLQKLRKRNP